MICEETSYAYSDGKQFQRTGTTFFQPREKYQLGTREGVAFSKGMKAAKIEDDKTQDNEKRGNENDRTTKRPDPVGD